MVRVFGISIAAEAQAKHCGWLKRREFVRYQFEKMVRARFSKQVNQKLQEFLDVLTDVERANIRVYSNHDAYSTTADFNFTDDRMPAECKDK